MVRLVIPRHCIARNRVRRCEHSDKDRHFKAVEAEKRGDRQHNCGNENDLSENRKERNLYVLQHIVELEITAENQESERRCGGLDVKERRVNDNGKLEADRVTDERKDKSRNTADDERILDDAEQCRLQILALCVAEYVQGDHRKHIDDGNVEGCDNCRKDSTCISPDAKTERNAEEKKVRAEGALNHNAAPLVILHEKRYDEKKHTTQSAGAKANVKDQLAVKNLKNICGGYVVKQKHGEKALEADVVRDFEKMLVPQLQSCEGISKHNE